ncbi:MAG: DUF1501 domain-containing protein [Phycisphaerales bacterium JB063]
MCNHYHPLSTNTPSTLGLAHTRRQFLGRLGLISAAATLPSFVSRSAFAATDTDWYTKDRPGKPDERVLVVVQLSGGNDGLNCVVPFGEATYYRNRPQLGIAENDALALSVDGLGLNPQMRGIHEMIGQGRAAVVNGVGYPNPNRSHFKSMDIWHSGKTEESAMRGRGWVGHAMDTAYPVDAEGNPPTAASMATIALGSDAPMATQGAHVKPVTFQTPEAFRWSARDLGAPLSEAYDELHTSPTLPGIDAADPLAFIQRTACDAQAASSRVRSAVARRSETNFPRNALAVQLEMVAKMVAAELPTRVYYVTLGGFDTHSAQQGRHNGLLGQFSQAMQAFYRELDATGHAGRVVSIAFSEFGRRLRQNASGGTDHGVAGPSFVFGDAINPGVHGRYPSLTQLDDGDLIHTTDFRALYADLLDNWMGIDANAALGARYEHVGLFG